MTASLDTCSSRKKIPVASEVTPEYIFDTRNQGHDMPKPLGY